jgi:hypothetical protein
MHVAAYYYLVILERRHSGAMGERCWPGASCQAALAQRHARVRRGTSACGLVSCDPLYDRAAAFTGQSPAGSPNVRGKRNTMGAVLTSTGYTGVFGDHSA